MAEITAVTSLLMNKKDRAANVSLNPGSNQVHGEISRC